MISMSKDFSLRALDISDRSLDIHKDNLLENHKIRNAWEKRNHASLFFNTDKQTFTFLGFNVDKCTGGVFDNITGNFIDDLTISKSLQIGLYRNGVNLSEKFDDLSKSVLFNNHTQVR